ncbi:MAG: hypothetical protein EA419_01380 [Wenzhouxiangella sp.]|nr:MAG: hypothetical protein EA419_01380 [Wenzhouxiangella sp.]
MATVQLALFQFVASLLLLVALASGIRRHLLRSEMLERSGQAFVSLREAGLYPDWLEIIFFHALMLATLLAAGVGLFRSKLRGPTDALFNKLLPASDAVGSSPLADKGAESACRRANPERLCLRGNRPN